MYRHLNPLERGRNNLGNGKEEIIRIPIEREWQDSKIADSILVWEFRRIVVRSESEFIRTGEINVKGDSLKGKFEDGDCIYAIISKKNGDSYEGQMK